MVAQSTPSDTKVHPFFTTPLQLPRAQELASKAQATTATAGPEVAPPSSDDDAYDPEKDRGKRRKRKPESEVADNAAGKRKRGRPPKRLKSPPCLTTDDTSGVPVPNEDGKTSLAPLKETTMTTGNSLPPLSTDSKLRMAKDDVHHPSTPKPATDDLKPKKMLNFNIKSGTLGSPPKPKDPPLKPTEDVKSGRPRGTRGKKGTLVVSVKYGSDDESRLRIGDRIDKILTEGLAVAQPPAGLVTRKANIPKPKEPANPKSTHPFFLGKPQKLQESSPETNIQKHDNPIPPSPKRFTSTPCSPKRSRQPPPDFIRTTSRPQAQFGFNSLGVKVPGARHPAWPDHDTVWVGCDDLAPTTSGTSHSLPPKKSKGHATTIGSDESVITNLISDLDIRSILDQIRSVNTDVFLPAPSELRIPRKHCESGGKLQARVKHQLTTLKTNPGTARFFDLLKITLSAHDRSQCESLSWALKYAPTSASDVLQAERETRLLKEWLEALQVQSVDTGAPVATTTKKAQSKNSDSKKKRKRSKLDGFVVDSDEEADELDELSESENDLSLPSRPGFTKKTVIAAARGGKDAPRLKNSVVISGPHGCGKTASVYAVAKELGFEVFEIGPNNRRSGKDILEKIGDMTKNHLVQHQSASTELVDNDSDKLTIDEDVAKEVQSGKQATMASFFKPKPAAPVVKPKTATQKAPTAPTPEIKKPSKSQKQSLILLEEVDILYEEDKQFWATVIGLMTQSKRPFIMTCNDESLVPLQSLSLHGIFRFSPPPTDLAVDRLLIMAACEGHALSRSAVEALYESRGQDLRASITELNYWCQLGVGDRRGGFDWFHLRWPKGIDQDENGDIIRVISEGTYQEGMGWLGRGHSEEEDFFNQAWNHFELDLGLWQDTRSMDSWASSMPTTNTSRVDRLASLEAYANFTDSMSIADLNSAMEPVWSKELDIDATQPPMPSKARDDYILGLSLLEATPTTTYAELGTPLSMSLKILARRNLAATSSHRNLPTSHHLVDLKEEQVIAAIRNHLTTPPASAPAVTRLDFAIAFDPIAISDEMTAAATAASHLEPSVWDRTMRIITLDVAPFVRGIVAYDSHLQQQRLKLSNLMSQGGKKRMRTTRAAYSAMEGGTRSMTRAERWFKTELNPFSVKATAPRGCLLLEKAESAAGDAVSGMSEEEEDVEPAVPVKKRVKRTAKAAWRNVLGGSSDVESARTSEDELAA